MALWLMPTSSPPCSRTASCVTDLAEACLEEDGRIRRLAQQARAVLAHEVRVVSGSGGGGRRGTRATRKRSERGAHEEGRVEEEADEAQNGRREGTCGFGNGFYWRGWGGGGHDAQGRRRRRGL